MNEKATVTAKQYVPEAGYESRSGFAGFIDSFKRMEVDELQYEGLTDAERAVAATAQSPLSRSLKARHLQMIAIGGSIGTGLFVGSGKALRNGGPASVLIAFAIVGLMLYCTVHALGELAVVFPVSGGFSAHSVRFIDPAWGFAMGWNYGMNWLIVFPLELVAASITLSYWQSDVNPAVWVAIFWLMIVIINLFGVKGYGEAEFAFSIIKITAVVGFIILGVILNCGGGPTGGYIGGKYWKDPGAFSHGFKGLASVFVTASFSFTGTELVGLAAAETENPRKTLPKAAKQVFWRITLFYLVSLTIIGLLVPYNDKSLIGSSNVDATASPFVIAINRAQIKVLPSIVNAVILIAVLSVGNSSIYGCSRTLNSLATQGLAPKFLGYIDRKGRPLAGIACSSIFGLLCFLVASNKQSEIFDWMMAICGLSTIFTWSSICLCHIRFRHAMKVQNRSLDEIPFKSQVGIYGSYVGVAINCLVLVAQFWIALYPIGGTPSAVNFFQSYLAVPVVIIFFVFMKVYKRTKFIRLEEIDLVTGRRETDLDLLREEVIEEQQILRSKGRLYRTWKFWC